MGITKSEKFTEEQNQIANIAKAFSHPARVAILQQLFTLNACICGDLVDRNRIGAANHFAAFKRT